jgi:hypothetical protein
MEFLASLTDTITTTLYNNNIKQPINIYHYNTVSDWNTLKNTPEAYNVFKNFKFIKYFRSEYNAFLAIIIFHEFMIISSDGIIVTKYEKNR